jgi:hypothetical protein
VGLQGRHFEGIADGAGQRSPDERGESFLGGASPRKVLSLALLLPLLAASNPTDAMQ